MKSLNTTNFSWWSFRFDLRTTPIRLPAEFVTPAAPGVGRKGRVGVVRRSNLKNHQLKLVVLRLFAQPLWQESFKALPLWSNWMIWQKINYIHNNPVKSGLVESAAEYRWSSFHCFYLGESEPLKVDRDWWWPEDVQKLARAAAEWSAEMERMSKAK